MPIKKIPFESDLYFEIQARYESKECTVQELADKYGVTREYLTRYAKQNEWVRGEQKKFIKQREILKQQVRDGIKAKVEEKVNEAVEIHSQQISEIKVDAEIEKCKAQAHTWKILNSLLSDVVEVATNGSKSDATVESFEYNEKGRVETKKTVSKSSKYKILNEIRLIDLLKGTGILQAQPQVAIQNNQNNKQEVKVDTTEQAQEKAKTLLASVIPNDV
jgi:hypothetical protein